MDALGVVVNPIAGMGGRVGLKGTDGKLDEARRRGAEPRAPDRAREALRSLRRRNPDCTVYTAAGVMGEHAARDAGFEPTVVYDPVDAAVESGEADDQPNFADADAGGTADPADPAAPETSADDTRAAVRAVLEHDVDLVLFVGGDGTAVDVASVLEAVEGGDGGGGEGVDVDEDLGAGAGENTSEETDEDEETDAAETEPSAADRTPMLGVPAGVKIYSSVFAVTPADAGRIAAEFDRVEFREVNDIDEDAYREGEVRTRLEAVVPVPVAPDVQSSKQVSSGTVDSLASGFAREIDPERVYVFGPGSTVGAIEEELGIDPSPLGVDVWHDGEVLARDAAESDILEVLAGLDGLEGETDEDGDDGDGGDGERVGVTIVVSPIGGQGFIFGRGNHQISPSVIERADEIVVVASETKLDGIDALHVDTDDKAIDDELRGWLRVRTGRFTTRLVKVV